MSNVQRATFSLRSKACFGALAVIVLITGTVSWLDSRRADRSERIALNSQASTFASGVAIACELPLAVGDHPELGRLAAQFLESEPIISFVAVHDETGALVAHASDDPLAWRMYQNRSNGDKQFLLAYSDVHGLAGDEFLTGFETDSASEVLTGRVAVGVSFDNMLAMRAERLRTSIATLLGAVALCVAVVTIIVGRWTKRLSTLVAASRRISSGDLSTTLQDDRPDEIGALVRSFEHMRCAIHQRDETERHRREELDRARADAERATAAKSQFLAHMSHEIRTPLNGVVGMLDLLECTELSGKQHRFVTVGRNSADALLDIINSILDFSKIEADELVLEAIDFDLHDVLSSVVEMLAPKGQAKHLEIACAIGRGVPSHATGDPARLRQVILNLLNNAIKFTEKGEVVVRAELVGESEHAQSIKIMVCDTGIGVPPESRGRLFKSFSQVDASTTRRFGGTGLGLAICKSLVEKMGGSIGIDETRTIGSEFWFTVELGKCDTPDPITSAEGVSGHRVLIVDDNETNREILLEALGNWNAEPAAAEDGLVALELLRAAQAEGRPFQFILLDMQMPEMDGAQFADAVQSDPDIETPTMIMLSSMAQTAESHDLTKFGISAYISKPVRLSSLYETMTRFGGAFEQIASPGLRGSPRTPKPIKLVGIKILVAEDNPINRIVISELLNQHDLDVSIVENGQEALDRWAEGGIDLILMDCEMPVMDGLTATRTLRARESAGEHHGPARMPIIALTANAVQGDRERCLNAGMDEYLTKPIDPPALLATIARLAQIAEESNPMVSQDHPTPELPGTEGPAEPAAGPTAEPDPDTRVRIDEALARCGGNPKVLALVFDEYAKAAQTCAEGLQRLLDESDLDELARSAHGMKGASANIGAEQARSIAGEIERLAREATTDPIAEQIDRLRLELADVIDAVTEERARLIESGDSAA